jgi:hypothetical protein
VGTQPKKSAGAKTRKRNATAQPKTEAAQVDVDVTETDADTPVETEQVKAPVVVPRRSADEWEGLSRTVLNVKPSILRLTLAGHAEGRKYTEDEIRRLIQRKLGEPA